MIPSDKIVGLIKEWNYLKGDIQRYQEKIKALEGELEGKVQAIGKATLPDDAEITETFHFWIPKEISGIERVIEIILRSIDHKTKEKKYIVRWRGEG